VCVSACRSHGKSDTGSSYPSDNDMLMTLKKRYKLTACYDRQTRDDPHDTYRLQCRGPRCRALTEDFPIAAAQNLPSSTTAALGSDAATARSSEPGCWTLTSTTAYRKHNTGKDSESGQTSWIDARSFCKPRTNLLPRYVSNPSSLIYHILLWSQLLVPD